uniref:Uncharacterized protein n=1 Tax=Picea sitchensis TaxID=3332 RepID=A9NTX9_PICSI|nr:unknown [Picea sitchensis]
MRKNGWCPCLLAARTADLGRANTGITQGRNEITLH